ncbi:hypothetical protein [Sphingomonas pituitosa]|uniref:hypothetical protein n=1 Tax=Sphingomonas pituitosa TaxID=99597 RepID=UPI000836FCD3|nr:hypothetical protein [Sphingomonas pituitosa]
MKRFFSGLLISIGLLIMTTSGLCSLSFVVNNWQYIDAFMLLLMLGFGGVPFAVGYGVFAAGRFMLWELRRDEQED